MRATLYRITDGLAERMMTALRAGRTLNKFSVNSERLETYFKDHPEYASEARPLIEANAKAARSRKGSRLRDQTHCKNGHSLADAYVSQQWGYVKRNCRTCIILRNAAGIVAKPDHVARAKAALQRGLTVNQIIHGRPTGGGPVDRSLVVINQGAFYRLRREDAEFDRFVLEHTKNHNSQGQRRRWRRIKNVAVREENNDYYRIRAMLPASLPDKDDVVSAIFEDLLTGALKREDIKVRVKSYVAAHNKLFPTKYAKFGGSPLVSLDEALYDDGSGTRGDNVTRGLWD